MFIFEMSIILAFDLLNKLLEHVLFEGRKSMADLRRRKKKRKVNTQFISSIYSLKSNFSQKDWCSRLSAKPLQNY